MEFNPFFCNPRLKLNKTFNLKLVIFQIIKCNRIHSLKYLRFTTLGCKIIWTSLWQIYFGHMLVYDNCSKKYCQLNYLLLLLLLSIYLPD